MRKLNDEFEYEWDNRIEYFIFKTIENINVGYPRSGFAYFPLRFTHKGDQNRIKRDQDRTRRALSNALFTFPLMPPRKHKKNPKYYQKITKKRNTFCKSHHDSSIEGTKTLNTHRPIELDELYRMDWFLPKFHAFISPKTAKYLQNPGFTRKLHQDSPIEGRKTSNLYRSKELDELYRMDWFLLKFHAFITPKTEKYLINLIFSRKPHDDSPIVGTKTPNLCRPIELNEIYRMHYLLFLWRRRKPQKNPKYYEQNNGKDTTHLVNHTMIRPLTGPKPKTLIDR